MIDKSRAPKAKRDPARKDLATFLPVPREKIRHDGWTPDRQHKFIEALADTGSVRAAAHAVNMTPEGAYLLRRHPEGGEFRKAWEKALKLGVQRLEDLAMERAMHGVEVPVYHFGEVVGARRVYNDRLLMFILRNRAGKRFCADGWQKTDASTRGELRKLKAQWHKEWERDRAMAAHQEETEVLAQIDAQFALMRQRTLEYMSPATREAHDTYQRLQEQDRESGYCPFDDEMADGEMADGEMTDGDGDIEAD